MLEISLEKDIFEHYQLLGDSLLNQIKYLEMLVVCVCLITLDKDLSKCSL